MRLTLPLALAIALGPAPAAAWRKHRPQPAKPPAAEAAPEATPEAAPEERPADPAELAPVEAAYARGDDRGFAVPLMVWGGAFSALGATLTAVGARDGLDGPTREATPYLLVAGLVTLAAGVGQLIGGWVMFDDTALTDDAAPAARRAHAAGYAHGVGTGLYVYAAVCAGLAVLGVASDSISGAAPYVIGGAALGHAIGGLAYRGYARSELDAALREAARAHDATALDGALPPVTRIPLVSLPF